MKLQKAPMDMGSSSVFNFVVKRLDMPPAPLLDPIKAEIVTVVETFKANDQFFHSEHGQEMEKPEP
jgi:hypothetical protein